MPQPTITAASKPRGLRAGSVVREAIVLALTLACGVGLVVLLIFAPRLFLASAPLAGVGSRQSIWLPQLLDYLTLVRGYLAGLSHGNLGIDRRGISINRDLL